MSAAPWQAGFALGLAVFYLYILAAGARTFLFGPGDEWAAGLAQLSFLGTGTFATMFLAYRDPVSPTRALAAAALAACSLALYEWARATIIARAFHIAWSGEVPEALCEAGPYRHVRHPVYASYFLAFAALLAAFPGAVTVAIGLFNLALFTHSARHDERSLAASELGPAYAAYKARTGMFVPRLAGRRPG